MTSKYKESENTQVATLNTYARFSDFQEKFYWSSQPAYIQNNIKLEMFWDVWYVIGTARHVRLGEAQGKVFEDNVGDASYADPGSARATSVSYKNSKYEAVTSGLSGAAYDVYFEYYKELLAPVYTQTSVVPTPDAGYKSRTDMARVRCVRKQ